MFGHQKNVWRCVLLLGLVVAFVGLAWSGWAAEGDTSIEERLAFPFMGIKAEQNQMLANAFTFQMQLFLGAAGQSTTGTSGLQEVRILALLAVLIGALLIMFFPKYQKPSVLLTWFLLVIVTLFVPLGSKMLFYPVQVHEKPFMMGASERQDPYHKGEDCKKSTDAANGCGFTPQLVAVHLGSTLQAITSSLFRSKEWMGLVDRQMAGTELYEDKSFNLGDDWIDANKAFTDKKCNLPIKSVIPNSKVQLSDEQKAVGAGAPYALSEVWKSIGTLLTTGKDGRNSVEPPFIVFPMVKDDVKGWEPGDVNSYIKGLTAICQLLCKDPLKSRVAAGTNATVAMESMEGTTAITVQEIVEDLKKSQLFATTATSPGKVYGNWSYLGPGTFFAPSSLKDQVGSGAVEGGNATEETTTQTNAFNMRACFFTEINAERNCASQLVGEPLMAKYQPSAISAFYREFQENNVPDDSVWIHIRNLMNMQDVQNMKVLYGHVVQVPPVPGSDTPLLVGEPVSKLTYQKPTLTIRNSPSCYDLGKLIVDKVISNLEVKDGDPLFFDKFVQMLRGGGSGNSAIGQLPGTLLTWNDLSSHDDEFARNYPDKYKAITFMAVRMNEAIRRLGIGSPEAIEQAQSTERDTIFRAAMINSLIELMQRVTLQTNNIADYSVMDAMAKDGSTINPKLLGFTKADAVLPDGSGDAFTTKIAGFTFDIGAFLAKIGAFFVGPLALTYIKFLEVLVDFTLVTVITLTPILFLFGLFIPTAAAGVMTTAVMSVFVLKMVPVTLIILNGVGGMIYDLLPGSMGINADFARDLLILAMGGLYTNLVGLTFFLMFKMGDPAAILGRLTALDSSAKQLADRGMAATLAIATAAAVVAGGAIGAGLGWFSPAMARRAAMNKLGMGKGLDLYEAYEQNQKNKGKGGDGKGGDGPIAPTMAETEGQPGGPKGPGDGLPDILGPDGKPMSDAAQNYLRSEAGQKKISDLETWNRENGRGLSSAELNNLAWHDYVTDERGNEYRMKNGVPELTSNGGVFIPGAGGDTTIAGGDFKGTGKTTGTATLGGGAGSGPIAVSVVGGQLDNVGMASMQVRESATGGDDVQTRLANRKKEQLVNEIEKTDRDLERAIASGKFSEAEKFEFQQMRDQLKDVQTPEDLIGMRGRMQGIYKAKGINGDTLEKEEAMALNVTNEIQDELFKTRQKLKNTKLSKNERTSLEEYEKKLMEWETVNPVGLVSGEVMSRLSEMKAAANLVGPADKMPGFGQTLLSGAYGGVTGFFGGGASRIPVLGPAISEVANEYYQGTERARGWNAVGGYWKMAGLKGDAQRLGFYQKEMAPVAAGQQYSSMIQANAFQAQADLARQSANEAVARSRSQYEALFENMHAAALKSGTPMDGHTIRNFMTVTDLQGLGAMEAANKITSVRAEAHLMQGENTLPVMRVKGGLTGNMLFKREGGDPEGKLLMDIEEVSVPLTAALLNKNLGDQALKKVAGSVDEMMLGHYGLIHKQYMRGDADWNKTRYMGQDVESSATFIRKDVSTDYLVNGHLRMVEGKEKFTGLKSQYDVLVKAQNQEYGQIAQKFNEIAKNFGGDLTKVMESMKISPETLRYSNGGMPAGHNLQVQMRAQVEKQIGKDLVAQGVNMPMSAIFNNAMFEGMSKYNNKIAKGLYRNKETVEAEYAEEMEKQASVYYGRVLKDVKNIGRKMSMDVNGVTYDLGKPTVRLKEALTEIYGEQVTEVDKNFIGALASRGEKAIEIKINKDKNVQQAYMEIKPEDLKVALNALTPDQQAKFKVGDDVNSGAAFWWNTAKTAIQYAFLDVKNNIEK